MKGRIRRATATLTIVLVLAVLAEAGCTTKTAVAPLLQPVHVTAPVVKPAQAAAPVSTAANLTAPAAAVTAQPLRLANLKLGLTKKWSGLNQPLYLTNAKDGSGRIFIVQQGGLVRVVKSGVLQRAPYLDLRAKISAGGERGLLGLAFSPTYKTDGKVYVDYTDRSGNTVIARYTTASPSSSAPRWGTPKQLLYIRQPYANHNGGCLQFGPDGYLYIGMGDGGSAGDPGNRAQNKGSLLGKILRIDVSRAGTTKPYLIPSSNPSRLTASAALKPAPEVWARGVRNPWRFSFDAVGGTLWVADVGQDAYEEVNFVTRAKAASRASKGGLNFGWDRFEGAHYYPSGGAVPSARRSTAYAWPTYNYRHPNGESITGGYVYRGTDYPALIGTYMFADYVKGWVGGIRLRAPNGTVLATREVRTLLTTPYLVSSFGVDERGELYLVDLRGSVYRVTGTAK